MQLKRWGKEKVTRKFEKETQCEVKEVGQCPYLGTTSSPCTLRYFLKKVSGYWVGSGRTRQEPFNKSSLQTYGGAILKFQFISMLCNFFREQASKPT